MFNIFKKKSKESIVQFPIEEQIVKFKDMTLQDIEISLQPDNKNNLLAITEKKSNTKIILDKEQAFVIANVLVSFYKNNDLNLILNIMQGK